MPSACVLYLTFHCCNIRTNPYSFLYAVTPIHTEFVDGYSDAKNSLAGDWLFLSRDYQLILRNVLYDKFSILH